MPSSVSSVHSRRSWYSNSDFNAIKATQLPSTIATGSAFLAELLGTIHWGDADQRGWKGNPEKPFHLNKEVYGSILKLIDVLLTWSHIASLCSYVVHVNLAGQPVCQFPAPVTFIDFYWVYVGWLTTVLCFLSGTYMMVLDRSLDQWQRALPLWHR